MKGLLHPGDGRGLLEWQVRRIKNSLTLQKYSIIVDLICQDLYCIAQNSMLLLLCN